MNLCYSNSLLSLHQTKLKCCKQCQSKTSTKFSHWRRPLALQSRCFGVSVVFYLSSKASSASAFWSFHPLYDQKPIFTFLLNTFLLLWLFGVCLPLRCWWQMAKHLNSWKHFIASSLWCSVAFNNYLKNVFKSRKILNTL